MAKYTEILQDYINEYKLMKELQGQSNIVSCDDFALEKIRMESVVRFISVWSF